MDKIRKIEGGGVSRKDRGTRAESEPTPTETPDTESPEEKAEREEKNRKARERRAAAKAAKAAPRPNESAEPTKNPKTK